MPSLLARTVEPRSHWARLDRFFNHDFCPWANRYVYWLKRPIGWFVVAAAASLLVGVAVAPQGLVMFGAILTVMGLGVCWPWLCMRAVSASLAFARHRCREQDTVQITLTVHNRWPLPVWGLAVEGGFLADASAAGGPCPTASLARVAGWTRSQFVFEFEPPQRGVYPVEPPRLTTGFPFGIWQSQRPITVVGELLVWPRTVPLESIPAVGGRLSVVAGMFRDRPGDDGDVIGVRPYRFGDSLRKIHWAQTARRDALVLCERQDTARRTVQVTLDDVLGTGGELTEAVRESAIRVGASICQEFHAHGCDVRCCLAGERIEAEPGPSGLKRLLDAFARYTPPANAENRGRAKPPHGEVLSIVVTVPERLAHWQGNGERGVGLHRCVVVQGGGGEERYGGNVEAQATTYRQAVWMSLCFRGDLGRQLRRQWERICHDA